MSRRQTHQSGDRDEHERRPPYQPREASFAGRIGGNQEFTVDPEDEEAKSLLEKRPDAVSCLNP